MMVYLKKENYFMTENIRIEECLDCGQVAEHKLIIEKRRMRVLNEMVEADCQCWVCQNCGDGYYPYDENFEKKVTESKRRQQGFLTGAEIKSIREKTGLSIPEFINLMKTYGGDCSESYYNGMENDTCCQNEKNEKAIREIAMTNK